ncbi:MAG: AAA family ATPase [Candidatus Saccharibacteria bacterium]
MVSTPLEQTVTRHQLLDSLSDDVADSGPTIITVSGVSGSGKSTIAELLARRFNGAYLEADHTHIGLAKLLELHGAENHDLIETYDYELVAKLAAELATGNSVQIPQYDFATAERTPTLREIKPRESGVVVVDGLYASELERVIGDKQRAEKKLKLKHVFVDTPLYVSVIRRILRDCSLDRDSQTHREVTFSDEGSLAYMVNTAIPTYLNSDYSRKFDYIAR